MFLPVIAAGHQRQPPSSTGRTARGNDEFITNCTGTSFGVLDRVRLVEWIEANRIFGVTLFNVYDGGNANDAARRVLEHYTELGVLHVVRQCVDG